MRSMQPVTLLAGETHGTAAMLPTRSNSRSTSGLPIIACHPSTTRPGMPFADARHPPTVDDEFDKRSAYNLRTTTDPHTPDTADNFPASSVSHLPVPGSSGKDRVA